MLNANHYRNLLVICTLRTSLRRNMELPTLPRSVKHVFPLPPCRVHCRRRGLWAEYTLAAGRRVGELDLNAVRHVELAGGHVGEDFGADAASECSCVALPRFWHDQVLRSLEPALDPSKITTCALNKGFDGSLGG